MKDGATTCSDDRLLVIGATNRPQEIDEAARRRLVKRLYIPLPDELARKQIINNLMRQQPSSLSDSDIEAIAKKTNGIIQNMAPLTISLLMQLHFPFFPEVHITVYHIIIVQESTLLLFCRIFWS